VGVEKVGDRNVSSAAMVRSDRVLSFQLVKKQLRQGVLSVN
jgi:hypothetical protein